MKTYQSSQVLKTAFLRIKKQNSMVSVRGLAARLGMSHVFLSKMISGKVPVPEKRLKDIIKVFQLDPFSTKELKEAMIADLAEIKKIDKILKSKPKKNKAIKLYEEQPIKHQVVLEHWFELPILDYLTCENLAKDTQGIAQNLAIKASEVELSLKKLAQNGLIEKDENGQWIKRNKFLRFPTTSPSVILRKYYADVLKRATLELSKDTLEDYERRLIVNFSIATQGQKIPEIKERISQFLYNLSVEMAEGKSDEVYHLTLALVPLTQPGSRK